MTSEYESEGTHATGSSTNPSQPAAPNTIPGPPANGRKRETSLFLSGSEQFDSSSYIEPTGVIPPPPPAPSQQTRTIPPPPPPHPYQPYAPTPHQPLGKQRTMVLWLLIAIPWVLVAMLLFTLIYLGLPHAAPTVVRHTPTNTPVATPVQTAAPTTQSPATGTYTSTTNEIAVQPTHFNAINDCQIDNGYRCTATIFVSNAYQGDPSWQASGDGALTRFSPDEGTFAPGQQQQVIIYIHNTCPASGLFTFSTSDNQITVPWNC
jgi:hypothetical protein